MRLFCLTNLDALLSLLLVELTWWGTIFFGQYIWYLFDEVGTYVGIDEPKQEVQDVGKWHTLEGDSLVNVTSLLPSYFRDKEELGKKWHELKLILIFGALLFLRLKAPLLLLVTVLKNKVNQHCQLLRIWYWISIFLDLMLVFYVVFLAIVTTDLLILLSIGVDRVVPFLVFRLLFWSVAKTIVADLSVKESSLFPVVGIKGVFLYLRENVKNALEILLSWEILINAFHLASSILYTFSFAKMLFFTVFPWAAFLPTPHESADPTSCVFFIAWVVHGVLIVLPSLLLAAVNKERKALVKFLIVLYILFGLVGYIAYMVYVYMDVFDAVLLHAEEEAATLNYIALGFGILLEFGQILLRLFLVEFAFQFMAETDSSDDDSEAGKEERAVLQPFLGKELLPTEEMETE